MKIITIADWIWKKTAVIYGRHYSDRCLTRFRKNWFPGTAASNPVKNKSLGHYKNTIRLNRTLF